MCVYIYYAYICMYMIYVCMKSSFAKTDNCIFFFCIVFLLRIPSNINQTAVVLFWLSNNNLNKYR